MKILLLAMCLMVYAGSFWYSTIHGESWDHFDVHFEMYILWTQELFTGVMKLFRTVNLGV